MIFASYDPFGLRCKKSRRNRMICKFNDAVRDNRESNLTQCDSIAVIDTTGELGSESSNLMVHTYQKPSARLVPQQNLPSVSE